MPWTQEQKEWQRKYLQRPEVKERNRIRSIEYRAKKLAEDPHYWKRRKLANKNKAIEYLGGKCNNPECESCPSKPHHYDIHHVITENKTAEFSELTKGAWKRMKREIDDCKAELLCAFCHRDLDVINIPDEE